jgi:hypothetical protein
VKFVGGWQQRLKILVIHLDGSQDAPSVRYPIERAPTLSLRARRALKLSVGAFSIGHRTLRSSYVTQSFFKSVCRSQLAPPKVKLS